MEQGRKLHPVIWVAAVSVTILSAVGVAAITGVLPHAGSQNSETLKPATVATLPAQEKGVEAVPVPIKGVEAVKEPEKAATDKTAEAPAPKPEQKPVAKPHKSTKPVQVAKSEPAMQPVPKDAAVPPPGTPYPPPVATPPAPCNECATVESVRVVKQQAQGSGLGAIAGGVVGGLLGNQVGGGQGRDIATIVGAVAGGIAGNTIEKNQRTVSQYEVLVRFEDGTSRVFKHETAPPWQPGDRVKVVNGEVLPR